MPGLSESGKRDDEKRDLDDDLASRIRCRRTQLLGLWAAAHIGKTGKDAESYAQGVVSASIDQPNDDALIMRIVADCAAVGMPLADNKVRAELDRLTRVAKLEFAAADPLIQPRFE